MAPQLDITDRQFKACVPNEDTDQPVSAQSDQRFCYPSEDSLGP